MTMKRDPGGSTDEIERERRVSGGCMHTQRGKYPWRLGLAGVVGFDLIYFGEHRIECISDGDKHRIALYCIALQ